MKRNKANFHLLKIGLFIVVLISVSLACALPSSGDGGGAGQNEEAYFYLLSTQSALETQQAAFAAQQTAAAQEPQVPQPPDNAPTPEPTTAVAETVQSGAHHRLPGLNPAAVLVWWLSDGSLVLEQPGGELDLINVEIEIVSPFGMPDSTGKILLGNQNVMLVNQHSAAVTTVEIDGSIGGFAGPIPDVESNDLSPLPVLSGAALSPDGNRILWLFDVTKVYPEPMNRGCDESWGCIGRVYWLSTTDTMGGDVQQLGSLTEKGTNYPDLEIAGWQSDMQAVFLKRNSHVPSALYPDEGGGIIEVSVPDGVQNVRDDRYLGASGYISPDGARLAWINDVDNNVKLAAVSRGGDQLSVPSEEGRNSVAAQVTFSPDGRWLVWLEVLTGESWENITSIEVHGIDLFGSAEDLVLAQYDPPLYAEDLPFTGSWLTDEMLLISTHHDTRILNVNAGGWVNFEWPPLTDTAILVGAVNN